MSCLMNFSFLLLRKNQTGWAELLYRFVRGGGSIYDIEFMCDDTGKDNWSLKNSYSKLSLLTDASVKRTPGVGPCLSLLPLFDSI